MRTFLALPLIPFYLPIVKSFIHKAKIELPEIKWVKPENVHITLHFFGETTEGELALLREHLPAVVGKFNSPEISLEGIDFFPHSKKPRIIWIALKKGMDEVKKLQSAIASMLTDSGFTMEDRLYTPHATVGRTKTAVRDSVNSLSRLEIPETESHKIPCVVLYESRLYSDGVYYEKLMEFPFQ